MILRFFRAHANVQLVMFFVISVLLWADGFYMMRPAIGGNEVSPLYNLLFSWCIDLPVPGTFLAFALLVLEALLLNSILAFSGVTSRNYYLPAFVFMLVFSYSPALLCMHPAIPANLLLLLALRMMWKSFHQENAYQEIFTAALFLSLAALLNIYYLVLIPLIWISLIINRSTNWREWFIPLLGIITPLVYMMFYYFWNNMLIAKLNSYLSFFKNVRIFSSDYNYPVMTYIICGVIFLISVISFVRFLSTISEKVINIRKISQLVIWMFILSAAMFIVIRSKPDIIGCAVLLPISVFISARLQTGKSNFIREVFAWLLIGGIVAGKFLI
jgi:hypothetical protein